MEDEVGGDLTCYMSDGSMSGDEIELIRVASLQMNIAEARLLAREVHSAKDFALNVSTSLRQELSARSRAGRELGILIGSRELGSHREPTGLGCRYRYLQGSRTRIR